MRLNMFKHHRFFDVLSKEMVKNYLNPINHGSQKNSTYIQLHITLRENLNRIKETLMYKKRF